MKRYFVLFGLPIFLLFSAVITSSCTCGFDCSRDNSSNGQVSLTLSFHAVLPEQLADVVLTVDSITFRRSGFDDVIVDDFTNFETGEVEATSFQTDLLTYADSTALKVIADKELDPDFYTIDIAFITGDTNSSFVKKSDDDTLRELKVTDDSITLAGVEILGGNQNYVVVFHLAQALSFNTTSGVYTLGSQGVRLQNESTSAKLSGTVDSQLLDTDSPCDEKTDPLQGNRVYLYEGTNLDIDNLADAFTNSAGASAAIAPFAVASLAEGDRTYVFNYLPKNEYKLAFTCNAEEDDAAEIDNIQIPLPTGQFSTVTLAAGDTKECDFGVDMPCAN